MPFYFFLWPDQNIQHLVDHAITPEEFEEVVCDPDRIARSRTSGLPIALGRTSSGRELVCVYKVLDDGTIYPVTAYEPDN